MSRKRKTDLLIPEPTRSINKPAGQRLNPSRDTLRVAAANRLLAEKLPSVVYQGRPTRAKSDIRQQPDTMPLRPASPAAKAKPDLDVPARLDLKPAAGETCKSRPASSKGSGGGRPFVPWCRRS